MNRCTFFLAMALPSFLIGCGSKETRNIPIEKASTVSVEQNRSIANFPIHGRFCGRNYPPVIYSDRARHISYLMNIQPQDDIDLECKKHDMCYARENSDKKNCDVLLRNSMPPSRLIKKEYSHTNTIDARVYKKNYCDSIISGIISFTSFSSGNYTSGITNTASTVAKGGTELVGNVGENVIRLGAALFNTAMVSPLLVLTLPDVVTKGSDSTVVNYAKNTAKGVFLIDDAVDEGLPKLKSSCNIWTDNEATIYEKERQQLYDRVRKTRRPNRTKTIGNGFRRKTKSFIDKL